MDATTKTNTNTEAAENEMVLRLVVTPKKRTRRTTKAAELVNTHRAAVLFYVRVSTEDKGQDTANQIHALTNRATIDGEPCQAQMYFEDNGVSGTVNPTERDGFKRLFNLVRRGDTIYLTALDRLSRNPDHCMTVLTEFLRRGVIVRTLREGLIDITTATGKLMVRMGNAVSEYERNIISDRTKQALARKKAEGVKLGRPGLADEVTAKAKELFQAGRTVAEVMSLCGISQAAAYRLRRAA